MVMTLRILLVYIFDGVINTLYIFDCGHFTFTVGSEILGSDARLDMNR